MVDKKIVYVTRAQIKAAKIILQRDTRKCRKSRPGVLKIAQARTAKKE